MGSMFVPGAPKTHTQKRCLAFPHLQKSEENYRNLALNYLLGEKKIRLLCEEFVKKKELSRIVVGFVS